MNRLFLFLLITLISCSTNNDEPPEIIEWRYYETPPEPIELTAEVFKQSGKFEFNLFLENRSDSVVTLNFLGMINGQPYDFAIVDEDSTLIWLGHRGSEDLIGTPITIEPGKEKVHYTTWDTSSNYNRELKSDHSYTLYGIGHFIYDWDGSKSLDEPSLYVTPPIEIEL